MVICESCGAPAYGKIHPDEADQKIGGPADVAKCFAWMEHLTREQFHVLVLNTKHEVMTSVMLYQGCINTQNIRPAEVFAIPLKMEAQAIALVHNHPSGDPTPSPEDVAITRRLMDCGRLLDLEVVDHIVVGRLGRFVSMKERHLGFDQMPI